MSLGKAELKEALNVAINTKIAKNVIVFIGDGMGPNTVTATRIYKHGESGRLTFEKFPHIGLLKVSTYNSDGIAGGIIHPLAFILISIEPLRLFSDDRETVICNGY